MTVDKMVTAAITPERIRLNRYLLFMFSTSFFFFFILHKNSRMFPPGLSVLIILLSRIICPSWILQTGIGTFVILLYSSPINPRRSRKVRNVNAGLSPISVFFAWVQDWLIACADMASASVIFDRTFPAWRVLSKQRHSSVPLEKTACRFKA